LADDPGVLRVAVAEGIEIHVTRLDARVERAVGQLDVVRDARGVPRGAAILGVDHRSEIARAVAPLWGGKLEREYVTLRAGVDLGPRRAAVLGRVADPFLAGDPGGLGVEAAHGEEGPPGVRVLPVPGGAAVGGSKDTPELADHPSLLSGGKA